MEKVQLVIEWLKANWPAISFAALYLLEQILPKINSVDANSMYELIFNLIVKLVRKDYAQPVVEEKK